MKNSIELIRGFVRDERGATAIEYALIASIISIAIAAVAVSLGETVRDDLFGKVSNALGS
jgi:pilus assembly protein Flp/PilA